LQNFKAEYFSALDIFVVFGLLLIRMLVVRRPLTVENTSNAAIDAAAAGVQRADWRDDISRAVYLDRIQHIFEFKRVPIRQGSAGSHLEEFADLYLTQSIAGRELNRIGQRAAKYTVEWALDFLSLVLTLP
jgi:hypothetical protein